MKKQITALCIVLVMLCTCLSVPTSAAVIKEVDTMAIAGHDTLSALGILDVKVSNYDSTIKRSNYVKFLRSLSGFSTDIIEGANVALPYTDVAATDSFYADVAFAYSLGYAEGVSLFRPNDIITVGEAAEMLIHLLGYGEVTKLTESSPLLVADRIGLFDNIDSAYTAKLTYADMFKMFYSALFIEVLEEKYMFESSVTYGEGKMLMTAAFDIYYGKGIVEANPITSIYPVGGCAMGCVRIDDILYKAGPEFYDMVGKRVEYFFHSNDDGREMIYIRERDTEDVFSIDTDNLGKLEKTKMTYTNENGKTKSMRIESSASFLYNGKLKNYKDIKKDNLDTLSGTVTLIDNDENGIADVVSIVSYTHIIVKGIDKEKMIVTGEKAGQEYNFEPDNNARVVEIYSGDRVAEFTDIKADIVLSVAQSDPGNGRVLIRAQLCEESIVGSVIYKDDYSITVDDTNSEFEKGYIDDITIGSYGTFKYAFNGKIVDANLENYTVYGYIAGISSDSFEGKMAKIFTDGGYWVKLKIADRINLDGTMQPDENVETSKLYDNGVFKPQLISYRVNTKNEVSKIDIAEKVERYSSADTEAIKKGTFRLSIEKNDAKMRNAMNSFDLESIVDANTFVFVVPDTSDMDQVYMGRYNSFVIDGIYAAGSTTGSKIYFYDIGEDHICRAMVLENDIVERSTSNDSIYPVLGSGSVLDSDGNTCKGLKVVSAGKEIMMPVNNNVVVKTIGGSKISLADIKKGDVVIRENTRLKQSVPVHFWSGNFAP